MRFWRHRRANLRWAWPAVLIAAIPALPTARAQFPQTRLDQVAPLGAAAGSSTEVDISGEQLDDVKTLRFDHPGLTAELVKPKQFRVKVAPETPPGTYELRAVGPFGVSGSRLFEVSRVLVEIQEKEPNDEPSQAQAVPLNSVVNGTSDGNGDDLFKFTAKKWDRAVIDCRAFRLDSVLRAVLRLDGPDGALLAQSRPYFNKTDPLIDVLIPADGDYLIHLHDATYAGPFPYRLIVTNRPMIENAFPPAVVPGETAELTLLGRNLPGGKPGPRLDSPSPQLDELTIHFTAIVSDPAALLRFDALNPMPAPSNNARGFQRRLEQIPDALNPLTLFFADAPIVREVEPNNSAEKANTLTLPAVVCGRMDGPGDADWFSFSAKANEPIAFDLFCDRMDAPGDFFVVIQDDKGNDLLTLDDHGNNINALFLLNRDPQGIFTPPADGTFRVLVQDRYRNGGPRYLYAMRVGKPAPDVFPSVFHETNPDPTCPVVRQGGSSFYEFALNRRDGFAGPATIEAEGLPPGLSCPPIHVSPQTESAAVVFTAAPDAPEWSGAIRLRVKAEVGGNVFIREVRSVQRRWANQALASSRVNREICLAIRPKAPYGLKPVVPELTVAAGGEFEAKLAVNRLWPDFKGKVQINALNPPPGFEAAVAEIAADKTESAVKVKVSADVPPGRYSLIFRGEAQVPFSTDPNASLKPTIRVADPAPPLTVIVTAAAKKEGE